MAGIGPAVLLCPLTRTDRFFGALSFLSLMVFRIRAGRHHLLFRGTLFFWLLY